MRSTTIILCLLAAGTTATAQEFTKVEVQITEDSCQWFDPPGGEGDGWQECPLHGNYKLVIRYDFMGLEIYDVATTDDKFSASLYAESCGDFQRFGDVIELRLAEGLPFAAIVQVICLKETADGELEEMGGSYLAVVGLKRYADLFGQTDFENAESWETARSLADQLYLEY